MSQLVTFYEDDPVDLKGRVEIQQAPMAAARDARSIEGAVRPSVVYERVLLMAGPLLVPFGAYDEWSLRDRYNEAIRIMNMLGASEITCETFGEVTKQRGFMAKVLNRGGGVAQERIQNSTFDYHHSGSGSPPRDPRPLRWPDEPGFAAAVSSVLDNGAHEVVVNIKSNQTHSINGELGLELKDIGFELGASTQKTGATRLHIRASFPQPRKSWR